MKKFKTLIPAFCAMLVSAVMLGTSTYAWFSVNKKVTATDMQVTAQSNTQYFVISADGTFNSNAVTDTAQYASGGIGGEAKVYPAAYTTSEVTDGVTSVTNAWYTANVDTYDGGTATLINVQKLDKTSTTVFADNANYFVGYTFYVGLAANSTAYAGSDGNGAVLKVKATADTTHGIAVAGVTLQQMKNASGWTEDTTVETLNVAGSTDAITSTEKFILEDGVKCVKVTVYVYIDGNNSFVIDSNIGSITGSVNIQVGASDATLA